MSLRNRASAVLPHLRQILELDRVIHEPARLVILTVLDSCASADFKFLESITGLTKGNLSAHTSKLESAGYIQVMKEFRGRKPATIYKITPQGKSALNHYRQSSALRWSAMDWMPPAKAKSK
jgi:DNA-binding PadR family transcriptional regulator